MKTLKQIGRTLFLEPFALKLVFLVTMLFAAIPPVQAVIGPYVKILLVWAVAVLAADVFTRRRALRNRYAGFFALFMLSFAVSIWLNRAAGMSENIATFAYTVVFFFVLFAYDAAKPPEEVAREITTLARVFVAVTALFALVCFATFLWSISYTYVEHTTPEYNTVVVIGMIENRLYGLYNANTGSTLNLLSSVFSLMLLAHGGMHPARRVAHWLNLVLQYVCMLLTLSRTAWYMYAAFAALFVFFVLPVRQAKRPRVAQVLKAGGAIAAAVLVIALSVPLKAVLAYAPAVVQSLTAGDTVPDEETDGESSEESESGSDEGSDDIFEPVEIERPEDSQHGGVLTGRTYLWRGGWQAFLAHPLFGTTRTGLYDAAVEHIPEYWHANLLRGGLHNIVMMVLCCSGGVGFAIMLGFLLFSGGRALKWLWRRRGERSAVLCNTLILLLITILGTEMLESRILYTTTVFGAVFWTFYGYAMQAVDACEPDKAACGGVYNRLVRRFST